MTEYPYEVLADAPLETNAIYRSGNKGTSADDPISKLVKCGNMGGFRKVLMDGTDDCAYIVIYSAGNEPEWPDSIMDDGRTFRYYGDNRKPGNSLMDTHNKGNKILKRCFDGLHSGDRSHIPPFLIFKKLEGQNSRTVRFLGVAVPGVKGMPPGEDLRVVTHMKDTGSFDNYEAHFTILPESTIDKEWLFSRVNNESGHAALAPESWKRYMSEGLSDERWDVNAGQEHEEPPAEKHTDISFFDYLEKNGLCYDTGIVEDFLLSLKAKQFLILSGGSGTGKTRMAQAYCRYRAEGCYGLVPVGSNWTDNRNMLGYMNALNGRYVKTHALDLILRAEGSDEPHILILDEMNLSHVERYFSDFLSSMESGEPVTTGSRDPEVPETVDLDDNLFVIGTVNMDETTYAFSPKVLDRANVIEFEPASISRFLSGSGSGYDPKGDVDFLQDCMAGIEVRDMSASEILDEMRSVEANVGIVDDIISVLESAQACMRSMKLPFGYRTLDELMRFMHVAWTYEGKGPFKNWTRYLDSQVMQKILPKVHGNSSLSEGLESFHSLCDDLGLIRSAEKLARMKEVLDIQRYVSFNC